MEFIFFWLILSILAGIFATSKGRSSFGWFVISFFLSPLIGFIGVAILPNRIQELKVSAPNPTRDRLLEIKHLHEEGLISQDEYIARRKLILESKDY
jgi:hypothetical protein